MLQNKGGLVAKGGGLVARITTDVIGLLLKLANSESV